MELTFQKGQGSKIFISKLTCNDKSIKVFSVDDVEYYNNYFRIATDGVGDVCIYAQATLPSELVVPSVYKGQVATGIGNYAFYQCTEIKRVTIQDGIEKISHSAFLDCTNLKRITIPDSVDDIITSAFENCTSLIDIALPDKITGISDATFKGCTNLTTIIIPVGLKRISKDAFKDCTSLSKVYYKGTANDWGGITGSEEGNECLANATCYYYSETKPTTEGNYWHEVDGEIFEWDGSACENGHTWVKTICSTGTVCAKCGKLKGDADECTWGEWEITKRQNCTEAGEKTRTCSVCGATQVKMCGTPLGHDYEGGLNVVLPTCIEKGYEEQLCLRCGEYIKNEIEPLGHDWGDWYQDEATGNYYCDCLRCGHQKIQQAESYVYTPLDDGTYSVSAGNGLSGDISIPSEYCGTSITAIADYAFFEFNSKITNVEIPSSIKVIGDNAFNNCTRLVGIKIPDSVTSIGSSVFYKCENLERVELGEGIDTIPVDMFGLCRNLVEVNIPDTVTSIGSNAFEGCLSLTRITIPDGVTSIGGHAFYDCYSLVSLFIPASVQRIHYGAFRGCANLSIEVDENSKYYRMRNGCLWEIKTSTVIHGEVEEIPDDTIAIGDGAFYGNTYFAPIKIPLSVTKIGSLAFGGQPVTVHVEEKNKPEGWADDWCDDNVTVVWGYKEEEDDSCSHSYGGWTTTALPTCTICGSMRRTCSICGNVDIALIDPLGHKYEMVVTPPTCGEMGYTTYICTRCGHSYKDNYVDATGEHHYEITTIPPTCEDEGYQVYACKGCNHSYTANFKEALGHNSSDWIIEVYPDFEMEGRKYKKCLRCGEILETATIPMLITYWDFTLLDDGTYSVKPLEDVQLPSEIDIPSEHNGIAVTRIENSAFEGYWNTLLGTITKVNIPSSITHIGDYAFQDCRGLTEITIPIAVTYVGRQAFYECGEDGITIYCEAPSQPSGWDAEWADSTGSGNKVVWNSRCINGHNIVDGVCTICGHIEKGIVYYGVSAIPERYNSAFVLGLDQKVPSDSHLESISVTPLEDEYIYYCAPTSFGDCAFAYNNFVGGFTLIIEGISLTNAGGKTEAYNIYKSNQANLGVNGAITITIKEMG